MSRSSLVGRVQLWVSHEAAIKPSAGAIAIQSLGWIGVSTFNVACSHGQQVGANFWQVASIPCHMGVSIESLEHPNTMAAGFHHSEQSKRQQGGSHMSFMTLSQQSYPVTSSTVDSLNVRVSIQPTWEGLHLGKAGVLRYCGHVLESYYPSTRPVFIEHLLCTWPA